MTQEQHDHFLAHCQDQPIACLELDGGDGICVAIPGSVWADVYLALFVHEEGTEVTWYDEEEGRDVPRDFLQITIPIQRVDELRAAIDKACEALWRQRQTQNWDWIK